MPALVSPSFLRAFLAAAGAPQLVLPLRADGLVLVPDEARYVVDGKIRPLAEDLVELPALSRRSGPARPAREAA